MVAYRQPVSRADIEEIRGVSVEGVLRSLLDREMIAVVGRWSLLGMTGRQWVSVAQTVLWAVDRDSRKPARRHHF